MSGRPAGRIPTERMNAGTPRTSSQDSRVCWKKKPVDQCELDSQRLFWSIGQAGKHRFTPIPFLPVNSALNPPPEVHSSGGKYKSIPTASLRNTVAVEIGSHRRSGKGTARKSNRAALLRPANRLAFLLPLRKEKNNVSHRLRPGREFNTTTERKRK